jgi:hypothetical protein
VTAANTAAKPLDDACPGRTVVFFVTWPCFGLTAARGLVGHIVEAVGVLVHITGAQPQVDQGLALASGRCQSTPVLAGVNVAPPRASARTKRVEARKAPA